MTLKVKAEHANAFLVGAYEVLRLQLDARPLRGSPLLRSGSATSARDLVALIALRGDLTGDLFYSMSQATATKVQEVLNRNCRDEAGRGDVVTQLSRLMATKAGELLAEQGLTCELAEPRLILGAGHTVTDLGPVLIVPFSTEFGDIDIGLALSDGARAAHALTLDNSAEADEDAA
ncbi:MAG: hypothetical protein ABFE08_06775 [Armatimonadia bacterium]